MTDTIGPDDDVRGDQPVSVSDISQIHDALREVAIGFQTLAKSISEESDRRRRISNRLIGASIVVMILGFASIFGFQVYRANIADDRAEDQGQLVQNVVQENGAETRRVLQEEIAKLQAASDPSQRITYDKLVVIVCDLDPSLCDADGNYVGR